MGCRVWRVHVWLGLCKPCSQPFTKSSIATSGWWLPYWIEQIENIPASGKFYWMSYSRACFAEVEGVCFGNLRMRSEVRRGVECGCTAFQLWELGLPLSRC